LLGNLKAKKEQDHGHSLRQQHSCILPWRWQQQTHHEASAEDLRRYAQSLSLDDLCGDKSELPVGSVWNLDAVEATLTKARAKGQTFDKDCYASPWPRE
jgi:hypothetical protein